MVDDNDQIPSGAPEEYSGGPVDIQNSPSKKTCCCSINKDFVPYKSHYFLLSGAHVGVIPYLPVYAKSSLGCSATTVGLLGTIVQLSTTISKPLFGLLADCLNQVKNLIAILLCLEVLLNFLMLALPPVELASMHHHHLPPSDASHFLRFAPARLYDASVGFHAQPKKKHGFKNAASNNLSKTHTSHSSKHTTESHSPVPSESTYKLKTLLKKPRSLDDPFDPNKDSNKCYLRCSSLVLEALCYQEEKECLSPQDQSQIDCLLRNAKFDRSCADLFEGSIFSMVYEIENITSANSVDIHPQSIMYYRERFSLNETLTCNASIAQCKLNCTVDQFCAEAVLGSLFKTYQFWTFSLFAVVGSMCQGAIYTLSDTVCYEKIRGTKTEFGKQRLWGAVGWGVIAPIIGYLNDLVTHRIIHEDYSSGWYIMAILSLFFLMNLYCVEFPEQRKSTNMWKDVKVVVCDSMFVLMELNVFFLGILNAYASNYVIWYMESMGSSRMLMGLALAMECLFGEAPFMYFSGWIISKLGHWHIVTLTFVAFSARFVAYYFITNPWVMLPVELLNGVTFGLFYTTMTSYGEYISKHGTEATIQGILGGTYLGLGSGVGSLVAGLSIDYYGGPLSFLFAGIFSFVLAVVQAILCRVFRPQDMKMEKLEDEENP